MANIPPFKKANYLYAMDMLNGIKRRHKLSLNLGNINNLIERYDTFGFDIHSRLRNLEKNMAVERPKILLTGVSQPLLAGQFTLLYPRIEFVYLDPIRLVQRGVEGVEKFGIEQFLQEARKLSMDHSVHKGSEPFVDGVIDVNFVKNTTQQWDLLKALIKVMKPKSFLLTEIMHPLYQCKSNGKLRRLETLEIEYILNPAAHEMRWAKVKVSIEQSLLPYTVIIDKAMEGQLPVRFSREPLSHADVLSLLAVLPRKQRTSVSASGANKFATIVHLENEG